MKKSIKINYPKKRSRINLEELGDVSEPERRSMYQVLLDNLKIANRATFLHRIIYIGAHRFPSYEDAKELLDGIIQKCNETYCIDKLTGFLLFYHQYFVHMVEGDEDNLNKHIGYLLDKKASHYQYLGTIKLLIHVSNINQRFFDDWVSFMGAPSKLLERLDTNADLQHSGRIIYNCIKKLYALMGSFADDLLNAAETSQRRIVDEEDVSLDSSRNTSRLFSSFSYSSATDSLERGTDASQKEYKLFLPEYELLDFIIKSSFTMKLQEYFDLYGIVPMRDIYKDKVWPVPHDFIPYDVFEKPYDCVTELPKEIRKRPVDMSSRSSNTTTSLLSFLGESRTPTVINDESIVNNSKLQTKEMSKTALENTDN